MINYINGYKRYLDTSFEDKLDIPIGYEDSFWHWFESKAKLYHGNEISRKLHPTHINQVQNMCYKNSYKISIAYVKKMLLYEGFSFRRMDEFYNRHSFNVNRRGIVMDYSLPFNENENHNFGIYIGVKIPLSFARKINNQGSSKDRDHNQYSLLVSYFLFCNNVEEYLIYSILP